MKYINIREKEKILYDTSFSNLLSFIGIDNTTIIYFSNKNLVEFDQQNTSYKNILFVSKKDKITKSILKILKRNVIIFIDIDNNTDFSYMQHLIKNLQILFKLLKRKNIKSNFILNNYNIIATLSFNQNMPYFDDICTSFKVLLCNSKKEKYEIIYDYVCTYLDNQFQNKNLCGFCNNICEASRNGFTHNLENGCCYSFDYGIGGIIINYTPCKYLVNCHCTAQCISCKLHTCFYLRTKNITFNPKNILLLKCFFSTKQHLIIKHNFFKTKTEIINKLTEINILPFIIYYILALYKIT